MVEVPVTGFCVVASTFNVLSVVGTVVEASLLVFKSSVIISTSLISLLMLSVMTSGSNGASVVDSVVKVSRAVPCKGNVVILMVKVSVTESCVVASTFNVLSVVGTVAEASLLVFKSKVMISTSLISLLMLSVMTFGSN